MNRNHVFDSQGPDLRVRGTSQQLSEKYLQLGRDATSSGDRVMAESYFQYAEHYFRLLNAMNQAAQQNGHGTGPMPGQANGQPPYPPRRPDMMNGEAVNDDEHGPEAGPEPRPITIAAGLPEDDGQSGGSP